MRRQWNEIVLENDDADEAFARAAPLLVEALQVVERARAVRSTVLLANHVAHVHKAAVATRASRGGASGLPTSTLPTSVLYPVRYDNAVEGSTEADVRRGGASPHPSSPHIPTTVTPRDGGVESIQEEMLAPVLEAIVITFAHLSAPHSRGSTESAASAVVRRPDGLVLPREARLQDLLVAQPLLDPGAFTNAFDRLAAIVSAPLLFTACEPRLRVLASSHALYRAYNSGREDAYHPLFGGGDMRLAPKVDIRRLETCVSSRTLLQFMEEVRDTMPGYVLEDRAGGSPLTVQDAFHRFFATAGGQSRSGYRHSQPTPAHLAQGPRSSLPITRESLCLRPSYTGGGVGVVDGDYLYRACPVDDRTHGHTAVLAPSLSVVPSTRLEAAAQLLQYFLYVHGPDRGRLLATMLRPVLPAAVATSGTALDALELELTLTGRDRREVERLADWCAASGLLGGEEDPPNTPGPRGRPQIQLCLRVTLGAYEGGARAGGREGGGRERLDPSRPAADREEAEEEGGAAAMAEGSTGHGARARRREHNSGSSSSGGQESGDTNHHTTDEGPDDDNDAPAADFAGLLENIFRPLWAALLDPPRHPRVVRLLQRLVAFSVQLAGSAGGTQEVHHHPSPPSSSSSARSSGLTGGGDMTGLYPLRTCSGAAGTPPPDSVFAFHVRRNVELLSCFAVASEYLRATAAVRDSEQSRRACPPTPTPSPLVDKVRTVGSLFTAHPPTLPGPLRFRLEGSVHGGGGGERGGRDADGSRGAGGGGGVPPRGASAARRAGGGAREEAEEADSDVEDLLTPASSDVRAALAESVLGLLLADEVVNPTHVFQWGPAAYLYYLTQRHLVLTPSKNLAGSGLAHDGGKDGATSLSATTATSAAGGAAAPSALLASAAAFAASPMAGGAAVLTGAVPYAVAHGLHASIATLDPLLHHSSNHALLEELEDTARHGGLAMADMTELCLRSVESRGNLGLASWPAGGGGGAQDGEPRRRVFGAAWPRARARDNEFAVTQVNSLRIRHRNRLLRHELELVIRKGLPAVSAAAQAASREGVPASGVGLSSSAGLTLETRRQRLFAMLGVTTAASADHVDDTPVFDTSMTSSEYEGVSAAAGATGGPRGSARAGHVESAVVYPRIVITGPHPGAPSPHARTVVRCLALRAYYQQFKVTAEAGAGSPPHHHHRRPRDTPSGTELLYRMRNGVVDLLPARAKDGAGSDAHTQQAPLTGKAKRSGALHTARPLPPLPTWMRFQADVHQLRAVANDGGLQQYAQRRLDMLEGKYWLHAALTNDDEESYHVDVSAAQGEGADDVAAVFHRYCKSSASTGAANSSPPHGTSAHAVATGEELAGVSDQQQQHQQHPVRRRRPHLIRCQDHKGDLYRCTKVDNHCHAASGVTATCLLRFMQRKLRECPDDVVGVDKRTGQSMTLAEMFRGVMARRPEMFPSSPDRRPAAETQSTREGTSSEVLSQLTIAALDVQAARATFNRFDDFNSRFSPMRMPEMRSLFLKTDNYMGGRYFAELIREGIFTPQAKEGHIFSEYRLSVYGRDPREWARLADWFVLHGMAHRTNRWMIQVPRLFALYRRMGILDSFAQMLSNIFTPLWEATLYPEKYPFLDHFLRNVSGFDSVDDESDRESGEVIRVPPQRWTKAENPPYAYYMYYMWANITTLNRLRAARGMSTFDYRPHAGESGDPDHMADVFCIADGIGHGIALARRPLLQYLYYLAQIPLSIVPLSNNALFCRYANNPFPHFFRRGLNVSLSTDGALVFHATEQPLLEEYSTARNVWGFSAADLCEIARNSVVMSGFPRAQKMAWLGPLFELSSVVGNDVGRSGVPRTRVVFRYESYLEEVAYLESRAALDVPARAFSTPREEEGVLLDRLRTPPAPSGAAGERHAGAPARALPRPPVYIPTRAEVLARAVCGEDVAARFAEPPSMDGRCGGDGRGVARRGPSAAGPHL